MNYVYPFIRQWAYRLSPFLSCSDQNGYKHECANISVYAVSHLFMIHIYLIPYFFLSIHSQLCYTLGCHSMGFTALIAEELKHFSHQPFQSVPVSL